MCKEQFVVGAHKPLAVRFVCKKNQKDIKIDDDDDEEAILLACESLKVQTEQM